MSKFHQALLVLSLMAGAYANHSDAQTVPLCQNFVAPGEAQTEGTTASTFGEMKQDELKEFLASDQLNVMIARHAEVANEVARNNAKKAAYEQGTRWCASQKARASMDPLPLSAAPNPQRIEIKVSQQQAGTLAWLDRSQSEGSNVRIALATLQKSMATDRSIASEDSMEDNYEVEWSATLSRSYPFQICCN